MSELRFEWNPAKAAANMKKHGTGFDEARSAFADERAKRIADPQHSEAEDRFILPGLSTNLKLLIVRHSYRSDDNVIRIISARRVSAFEPRHC